MTEHVKLIAADAHELDAYIAKPTGEPIAALVVVQEIFGVNRHIRDVVDGYAKDGFFAIAPALFDRYERGVDLHYEGDDMKKAMTFIPQLNIEWAVADTAAAIEYARTRTGLKVGIVGYCLGGTIAWLVSTRLKVDAAVGYYGGHIANFVDEQPKAPTILHFGSQDTHIPRESVDNVAAAHPEVEIYWYDAGHGFNCDRRASYDAPSSQLARERSLDFLKKNLA